MYAARNARVLLFHLNQKAFYSDLPGKRAAIALRVATFEILPGVKALFPVQFKPPWC